MNDLQSRSKPDLSSARTRPDGAREPKGLQQLQRTIGNQAVLRLLSTTPTPLGGSVASLQHTIGNGGVAKLLAPLRSPTPSGASGLTVQRKMSFRESDLLPDKGETRKAIAETVRVKDTNTWKLIGAGLGKYWATRKSQEEFDLMTKLSSLSFDWMRSNPTGKQSKRRNLFQLQAAITAELPKAKEQMKYVKDFTKKEQLDTGFTPGGAPASVKLNHFKKYRYLSDSAKMNVADKIGNITDAADASPESMLIREHHLSDADVAGIKVYTVDDYKYINPALAYDNSTDVASSKSADEWMERQILKIKSQVNATKTGVDSPKDSTDFHFHLAQDDQGRAAARAEGRRHAQAAIAGLKKLPDFIGEVYRGRTIPRPELAKYLPGQTIAFDNLTSTSWDPFPSMQFVEDEMKVSAKDGKDDVGLWFRLRILKGGKEISAFSLKPEEHEVLLLPNQKFKITQIEFSRQTGLPYHIVHGIQLDDHGAPLDVAPSFAEAYADQSIQGKIPGGNPPQAVLLMGGPGAGKSTVLPKAVPKANGYVRVDPDEAKAAMPEYRAGVKAGDKEIAAKVHGRSKQVAGTLLNKAIFGNYNIIYDGTGGDRAEYLTMIKALQSQGYDVRVVLVHVPSEEGLRRVKSRARKEGRHVDEKTTKNIYFYVGQNFGTIAEKANNAEVWTNLDKPNKVWVKGISKTADLSDWDIPTTGLS